jgi:hypothetical protein
VREPAVVAFGPAARALAESTAPGRPDPDSDVIEPSGRASVFAKTESELPFGEEKAEDNDEDKVEDSAHTQRTRRERAEEDQQEVEELRQKDRQVRAHELAHKSTGGRYTGQIRYEYERGPDGKSYVVGGEVPIDVSPVPGDPAETIRKMDQVRRAALAPADPSGADRQVATLAARQAQQARLELAKEKYEAATADEGAEDHAQQFAEPSGGAGFAMRGRLHGLEFPQASPPTRLTSQCNPSMDAAAKVQAHAGRMGDTRRSAAIRVESGCGNDSTSS